MEFNEKIINEIAKTIQNGLLRIGITTNVKVDKHNDTLSVTTSDFQTQPVLFKRVYIDGVGKIVSRNPDAESIFNCSLYLDYRWESFLGGRNGTELGQVDLIINTCFESVDMINIKLR